MGILFSFTITVKTVTFLAAAFFACSGLSAGQPVVAVAPFEAVSGAVSVEEADALTAAFCATLEDSGAAEPVDRKAVAAALAEYRLKMGDRSNREKAAAAVAALKADWLVRCEVSRFASGLVVSATFYGLGAFRQVSGSYVRVAGADSALDGIGTLVDRLVPVVVFPGTDGTAQTGPAGDFLGRICDDGAGVEISGYVGPGGNVAIPREIDGLPVKSILKEAFRGGKLTGVVIPRGVVSVGERAFYGNRLSVVAIPGSVTEIGSGAFEGNLLSAVAIPAGAAKIGDGAFNGNAGLKSITVSPDNPNYSSSDGVLYDKNRAVLIRWPQGKPGRVSIPGSVRKIGAWAFYGNRLSGVAIPNGVTEIGEGAFRDNELARIAIPKSVAKIGVGAFRDNRLVAVDIPPGVAKIEVWAFCGNRLSRVVIPSGVTEIGYEAFCVNRIASVVIPGSVKKIGAGAFYGNRLSSVAIPAGVAEIGHWAFRDNRLVGVSIGANVTLETYRSGGAIHGILGSDTSFDRAYNDGGKRAGNYARANAQSAAWTRG